MKTTTSPIRNSMNHSALGASLLIPLLLLCFAFSPQARAVCQQGCDLTNNNTFLGDDALVNNAGGAGNTAMGASALTANTIGSANTAVGSGALEFNMTGSSNTATGYGALFSNTGNFNTANGVDALYYNTSDDNTATGFNALFANTIGSANTATGLFALQNNTIGSNNTANGWEALAANMTGHDNIADGFSALRSNTTGSFNIALGSNAGVNLTTGSNNIDVGNNGVAGESKHIRIGTNGTHTHTFIAGISGATVAGGVGVIIDTKGHLGTVVSSERFKEAIEPMDSASESILALKPVTFRYKQELDPDGIPQFGLVAEDVERVDPDLVARDADGKAYTVRYDAVNAMLLNEFLKEHRKVQELEAKLAQQENDFSTRLKEQDAKIQQVNDKLELSKSAPRTVLNNQ